MVDSNLFDKFLALGTLLLQIGIVFFIFSVLYFKNKKLPEFLVDSWNYIRKNSLLISFLIVLGGSLSSLFYSEIIGYPACKLCWFQRSLIYPQVFILGVAIWKKQKDIFDYVIGLNIIGLLIAIYNYYLQRFAETTNCGVGEVACNSIYIFEFGYITIPMMSITLFVSVFILTYIYKFYNVQHKSSEESDIQ